MKPRPFKRPIENFMKHIQVSETGCWLWTAKIAPNGYGHFQHRLGYKESKTVNSHRFSYEYFREKIPDGLVIDHLCRVSHCVNPYHLEAVTQQTNVFRGNGLARKNHEKTHCIRGHELSGENLYICPLGKRNCKKCRNETARRWHLKKVAKHHFPTGVPSSNQGE
jgi:hypothetical protein